MKIRMLTRYNANRDYLVNPEPGFPSMTYFNGEIYDLKDFAAKAFIEQKLAELVKTTAKAGKKEEESI